MWKLCIFLTSFHHTSCNLFCIWPPLKTSLQTSLMSDPSSVIASCQLNKLPAWQIEKKSTPIFIERSNLMSRASCFDEWARARHKTQKKSQFFCYITHLWIHTWNFNLWPQSFSHAVKQGDATTVNFLKHLFVINKKDFFKLNISENIYDWYLI